MAVDVSIRPAEINDADTIVEFNIRLAQETEDKELNRQTLTQGVQGLLANPDRGRYFVAVHDGKVVGQLMHTHEWSDWRNGDIWWLQSVYVHRDFRRQGIFKLLLNHLTDLARNDTGVVGLRLYVERDNSAAQSTYVDLGFADPGYKVYEVEFKNS